MVERNARPGGPVQKWDAMLQRSLKALLVQSLVGVVTVGLIATVTAFVAEMGPPRQEPAVLSAQWKADTRLTRLIARRDCWTGEAPADMVGQEPGHVLVTHRGRVRYSARLVDEALEQVFANRDHDIDVRAFCR
jgi:hypothetical protein